MMNDLLKSSEAASSAPVGTAGGCAAGHASAIADIRSGALSWRMPVVFGVVRMLAGVEMGGRGAVRSEGGTAVGKAAEGSAKAVGGGTPQGASVFIPVAVGGRASAPVGGRRAAAALPTSTYLRIPPGGASGRHGRDGPANEGRGEAANGTDVVMAAVAASMKDQVRQFIVTAELRRHELRNKRIVKYTKLVLPEPGNGTYAKMLAAEAAGEDGDGDEEASP